MKSIDRQSLRAVLAARHWPSVSIYLPTSRAGGAGQQGPIRLKNLLGRAEQRLVERGVRGAEARTFLEPLAALTTDSMFWREQSEGLALFLGEGSPQYFRLPLAFEEQLTVDGRFHITPLLPLVNGDGRFLLLAVSQKRVRMLEGDRWAAREIDLATLPGSLTEALNYDEPQSTLQLHTARSDGYRKQNAAFHGQGGAPDAAKDELRQYFLRIDRPLADFLANERAPLVFAGVDYLFPMFREVCRYPRLVEKPLMGNPDLLSVQELHSRAWQIVESLFRRKRDEALADFQQKLGSDWASRDLQQVVVAAEGGAVETLLVRRGTRHFGRIEPDLQHVVLDETCGPTSEDLVDRAVCRCLEQGGSVYPIESGELAEVAALGAIFRYPWTPLAARPAAETP